MWPTVRLAAILLLTAAAPHASAAPDAPALTEHDVPYLPTPPAVVERMLDMAQVGPDDFVIDLGSGDGRIPIAAARRGARALGVELDAALVAEAQAKARAAGVEARAAFRRENLFLTDISAASVLTLYLGPDVNISVRRMILAQMRPGARVVSHQFGMEDWRPDASAVEQGRNVLLWIVPARVEDTWRVEAARAAFDIELTQTFQAVSGVARLEGRTVPLLDVVLRGAEIAFALEAAPGAREAYRGAVEGAAMAGRTDGGAIWRAARR